MNAFAERLRSARKMKGWSLQDLADKVSVSITRQALNKYEQGTMKPTGEVLIALSKVLEVKPDYFLRESAITLPEVKFRKKAKLSAKEIDRIKENIKDFLERYLEVESLLNLKEKFVNPLKEHLVESEEDVEEPALDLIKKWKLGFDPIPNVLELLEEKGIRIMEMEADPAFDGLSAHVGMIPVIVINKNFTVERKRFTALHELGHLLLNIDPEANEEKICNAFAAALLLPDGCLEKLLGDKRNNIAMGELMRIKEQYGISVQAIMSRAYQRGIIQKNTLDKFWRTISSNKKEEGLGTFSGKEKPYRFEQLVFRLAAEEIVSMSKAANLAGMKLAQFRDELDAIEL
jgi:Zn-dependent peptidase ImmA (M78 family)/DNA-binding XRE family transcriptional regulator